MGDTSESARRVGSASISEATLTHKHLTPWLWSVFEGPTTTPNVDLWHDTFPVPPKNGNTNDRVFIFIPFEAEEQLGRFVFHCHILEHEDNGMMAAMEVVREVQEADEPSNAGAMPNMPMRMRR